VHEAQLVDLRLQLADRLLEVEERLLGRCSVLAYGTTLRAERSGAIRAWDGPARSLDYPPREALRG